MPLAGEGRKPRLHRRHRVYKLVEDTKHRPKDNLELILTQSVEGKARAELLPFGLVVFGVPCFLPMPFGCLRPFPTLWKSAALYSDPVPVLSGRTWSAG